MTNSVQLPLDIVDIVFEELWLQAQENAEFPIKVEDPGEPESTNEPPHPNHDLASCSLVSRDWRELSLRHLFHTITITVRPWMTMDTILTIKKISADWLISTRAMECKTLKDIRKGLIRYPVISKYVTKLTLSMRSLGHLASRTTGEFRPTLSFAGFTEAFTAVRFERLEDFTLRNIQFDEGSFGPEPPVLTIAPTCNLKWLRFLVPTSSYIEIRPKHIRHFYPFFNSIEGLVIDGIDLYADHKLMPLPPGLRSLILLGTLAFNNPECSAVEGYEGLSTLKIGPGQPLEGTEPLESVLAAVEQCQSTLEVFNYEFLDLAEPDGRAYMDDHWNIYSLDLSACHSLHTVVLTICVYPELTNDTPLGRSNDEIWSKLADAFTNFPPPALRDLTFVFHQICHRPAPFEFSSPHIIRLEGALARLPNLQRVHLLPRRIEEYSDSSSDDGFYSRRFVYQNPREDRWCDGRFPFILFAGLLVDRKIVVQGGYPSKPESDFAACHQWNEFTPLRSVMMQAMIQGRKRKELRRSSTVA